MTELLPRSRPEAQGVPSAALGRLVVALDALPHVHTLTVARHGEVVAEFARPPYDRETPHAIYSVSKSFTSIAIGIAIGEGLFGLDDRVIDLLPDDAPEHPSAHLQALRVRHVLTMTTGHEPEPEGWEETREWARSVLAADIPYAPGTHWLYNTAGSHLLSQIIQVRTGERLLDYLKPRLFDPLGFQAPTWFQSPTGVDAGGFGLSIRAEELAAFGQLLLQRGRWHGRQLVPAHYIDQASRHHVANGDPGQQSDWGQGYGFQFWRCRHDAYRGDGAFGQYVVVMPGHDAVVAITGGLDDMQPPLQAVWDELLPAFDTAEPDVEVPSPTAIAPVGGERRDTDVSFEYGGPVRRVRVSPGVLSLDSAELAYSPDDWVAGRMTAPDGGGPPPWYGEQVAASGGWQGDTFVAEVRMLEDAVTFRFEVAADGQLTITRDVGFDGPDVWQGEADAAQPDVPSAAHHSVVSP